MEKEQLKNQIMIHYFKQSLFLLISVLMFSSCEKEESPSEEKSSQYSITESSIMELPIEDATAVATDKKNFWILSTKLNSFTATISYFNPKTKIVEKQFTYDSLSTEMGSNAKTITWDGEYVWILFSHNDAKFIKIDPSNGAILKTLNASSISHIDAMDWDFGHRNILAGTHIQDLYSVVANNGDKNLRLRTKYDARGMAIRNNEVWLYQHLDNYIHIYNKDNSEYCGTIFKTYRGGGDFCFFNDKLAVIIDGNLNLFDIYVND